MEKLWWEFMSISENPSYGHIDLFLSEKGRSDSIDYLSV